MSLRHNIVANYVGQAWRVLILLAFVPLYIKYIGIEAYGLIGIFAVLQAWLGLLDLSARPVLAREMARFAAGAHNEQVILDLLRSIEVLIFGIAALVSIGVFASSGWLATNWVKAGDLQPEVIERAFTLMGFIIALRFIENVYSSSLAGLQRQVVLNAISIAMMTLQGLGAVAVLAWVSPTIEMFFIWQLLVSLATVAVLGATVYRALPLSQHTPRFSWSALRGIRQFAAGMAGITVTALMLTQVDKVLLSHWMSLEAFGYYALANLIASGLDMFTGPVAAAVYPHFIDLVTRGQGDTLRQIYHQSAQLITVFAGSVAAVLIIESERVLVVWTGDSLLSQQVAPIMALLVLGTLLHCMVWIPYQLQLAHAWTSLAITVNAISIILLLPTLFYVIPIYGAIGAAWVWVALNAGYVLVSVQVMHRVLLTTEKWSWYWNDVLAPILAAMGTAWLCRAIGPKGFDRLGEMLVLASSLAVALACSVLAAPLMRRATLGYILKMLGYWRK